MRRKNTWLTCLFAVLLFSLSVLCIVKPADVFSESERRTLAVFPELNLSAIANGEFSEGFETYATERFPFRDEWRRLKAFLSVRAFLKLDNNGLFVADGHLSKIDEKENPQMLEHAAERFTFLYESFMQDKNTKVYFSVIPDKNKFLARRNGYPSLDYAAFTEKMKEKTSFMTYIDVADLLDASDYYTTDTHWRQEKIVDVAERLGDKMGTDVRADYAVETLPGEFRGVYMGQYAMPFPADTISYLTNETLKHVTVTYYDTGMPKTGDLYNMEKAQGKDPYEMFLSGTTPLVTIENPDAKTDKELVMIRDSFGSSIAPLMAEGYKKITLVDIRYMKSGFVGNLVDFEGADVLFIYSTTLLNNSLALQ